MVLEGKCITQQECIPVGCVPSAVVAVSPATHAPCHTLPPATHTPLPRTPPCHTHPPVDRILNTRL